MNWTCPSCRLSNSCDVPADAAAAVTRWCSYCGSRLLVDPSREVAEVDHQVTSAIPLPRATKRGAARPILVLMHGRKVGAELPLPPGVIRIGSSGSDWEFPDQGLEPVHFEIDATGPVFRIRDLTPEGSTGVQVNTRAVFDSDLRNGDQIHAGRATFLFLTIFRDESAPPASKPVDSFAVTTKSPVLEAAEAPLWEAEPISSEPGVAPTVLMPKLGAAALQPKPSVSIQIESGEESGKQIPLMFASNIIGRGLCEVPLIDPLTSQRHAEIGQLPDGAYFLKDLASANGTYLNGRVVQYSPLHSGDVIQIGETLLRFLQS